MHRRTPKLPEAELDVLVALHRHGPNSAADLVRLLAEARPMSHGAVATLLGRLERKGLVAKRKGDVGKAFIFSATGRAGGALRGTVQRLFARVFGDDRVTMVATLFESAPLDAAEVKRLEALVGELAAGRASRPRERGRA